MKVPTLTKYELRHLMCQSPETYESLASYHEVRSTEAESVEPGLGEYHDRRKAEMLALADHIRQAHEEGEGAVFENDNGEGL